MAAKTKKFKVDPMSRANSDINVTPLVDVVLVLLIIFMVVTPLMEKDIQVRVPPTEVDPNVAPPPPDQAQVVITLSAAGAIAINNQPLSTVDEYIEKLTKVMRAKPKADRIAFFMPDDNANYGKLIELLDGAKAAKVDILGMVTEIPAPGGEAPAPAPTP